MRILGEVDPPAANFLGIGSRQGSLALSRRQHGSFSAAPSARQSQVVLAWAQIRNVLPSNFQSLHVLASTLQRYNLPSHPALRRRARAKLGGSPDTVLVVTP